MALQLLSSDNSITIDQLNTCSWDLTIPPPQDNNLVYGGVVTWLQDYDFYVSPAGYYINGEFYESPEAYITLNPADPSLDRFDVIYVDADEVVKVLEGSPSLTPSQPGLDLGLQLGLGVVFVQAGSSSPVDIVVECLSGWTPVGSDGDVDVASPNANCVDASGLEVTNGDNGDYAVYDRGSTFLASTIFNVITFRLKPKGDWSNDPNLNHRLKFQFYLSGIPVGSAVYLGDTGFNFSSTNLNCQIISIPVVQFGLSPTTQADQFRITVVSEYNPPNYPFGFYLDGLCLQGGIFGATESDDIHNQYFGPQTPGRYWISGNARIHGWVTSPDMLTGGDGSEKFGWGSRVTGSTGTAIGFLAQANGQEGATAVGNQAVANVGVAIGFYARSNRGVAVGGAQLGSGGTAVGGGSLSSANSAIAIGGNTISQGISSIALGDGSVAGGGYGGIAIGGGASATHSFSAAMGVFATTTADRQFVIGADHPIWGDFGFDTLYFGRGVTSYTRGDKLWTITGSQNTDIAGDKWILAGAKGTGNALSGTFEWHTSDPTVSGSTLQSWSRKMGLNSNTLGFYMDNTRFQLDEGSDVTAAGDLTLGTGNAFTVNGNTGINAITSTNWQDGAVIYLLFTGTPTVQHNVVGGAGTSPIRLAGAVDFSVTNNTVLQLQLKDGYWREVGRTQASAIGPYTFLNGIHEELGGLVKLGGTLIENTIIDGNNFYLALDDTRFQLAEGANVVAANDLTLGNDGNAFTITGNTQTNAITTTNWQEGSTITLHLTGTPTLKHNTAGGAGTAPLRLAGAVDFVIAGYTVLELQYKDGFWNEVGRTISTGGGSGLVSANNALSLSTATNVQLGGSLIQNTTISGAFPIAMSDNDSHFGIGLSAATLATYVQSFAVQKTFSSGNVTAGAAYFNTNVAPLGSEFLNGINSISSYTTLDLSAGYYQGSPSADISGSVNAVLIQGNDTNQTTGFISGMHGAILVDGDINVQDIAVLKAKTPAQLTGGGGNIITNIYGLYIDAQNVLTGVTNTYGIHQVGGTDLNYLAGPTAVGDLPISGDELFKVAYPGAKFFRVDPVGGLYELGDINTSSNGTYLSIDNTNMTWTATNIPATATTDVIYYNPATGALTYGTAPTSFPGISADNGLTENVDNNVQLGATASGANSPLLHNTYINTTSSYFLEVNGSKTGFTGSDGILRVVNTGASAIGLYSSVTGGGTTSRGVWGNASGGAGVRGDGLWGLYGVSSTGYSIFGSSTSTAGGIYTDSVDEVTATFVRQAATTNSVLPVMTINRATTGTAANGIGASIDYKVEVDNNTQGISNQIISKLTTAANASYVSQLIITGVNNAVTADLLTLSGSGALQMNKYGVGSFTAGTAAYLIATDASGNWFEYPAGGVGSGLITADNGLTVSAPNNVQLGATAAGANSPLLHNSFINTTASFYLEVNGSLPGSTSGIFRVNNTSATGTAIYAATSGGYAVRGETTGLNSAGSFVNLVSGTNSVVGVMQISAQSSGTTLAGFGGSYDVYAEDNGGVTPNILRLAGVYTDPATGSVDSELRISVQSNNNLTQRAVLTESGQLGLGIYTGLTATRLDIVDNTVAGAPIVNITSTSTAATGSLQKGINVSLSGAHANSGQNSYGVYSSNTHTGTFSQNFGVYGSATGAASVNVGVAGYSLQPSGTGVFGNGGGWGGDFTSSTGVGLKGSSYGGSVAGDFYGRHATTTTKELILAINRDTTGLAANGIGGTIVFGTSTTNGTVEESNRLTWSWVDATQATRTSQFDITGTNSGSTNNIIMSAYSTGVVGIGISSGYTARRLDIVDNAATTQSIAKIASTSLSSGNALDISIVSTAATGNTQRGINVALSGANGTGSQTTVAIAGINTHSGSGVTTNIGLRGEASNSGQNNYGVFGTDGTGMAYAPATAGVAGAGVYGVYGFSSSNTGGGVYGVDTHASGGMGVFGTADGSSATGVAGVSAAGTGTKGTSDTGVPLKANLQPSAATPNTVRTLLELQAYSNSITNVPGNGYGGSILWNIITNNGGNTASRTAGAIEMHWTDVTDASRTSEFTLSGTNSATTQTLLSISGAGIFTLTQGLTDYADDAAASAGGIPVNGLYRTASVVKIRVS